MKIDPREVVASEDERKDSRRIREGGSIAEASRNRWQHWIWHNRRTEMEMKIYASTQMKYDIVIII